MQLLGTKLVDLSPICVTFNNLNVNICSIENHNSTFKVDLMMYFS